MSDRGARYTLRKGAGKKVATLLAGLVLLAMAGAGLREMLRDVGGGRS